MTGEATEVDERWRSALRRDILRAKVDLECTIVQREMSLREVIDLKEGDIISVDIPDKLVLKANGVPVFNTRMGTSRGNLALEVLERTGIDQIDNL
jgi:flagellar motor switch protein FliM